jgi:hypothetical protein
MTTTPLSFEGHRERAINVAVRLGLLWQAAFSVAMLRHYVRHGSSFYLSNIAGAWPYVHQHILWISAFVALCCGARPLARVLAAGGAFLAVVQIVSFAHGGGSANLVVTVGGVACFGVVPAIALLIPGATSAFRRRLDWLSSGLIVATVVSLFHDGVAELASGGMQIGPAQLNGVLRAVWVGWVACIVALAWRGRSDRFLRLAALLSAGHLLLVELAWLASDVAAFSDLPGGLPLSRLLPFDSVSRVLFLAAILAAAFLLPPSAAPERPSTAPERA